MRRMRCCTTLDQHCMKNQRDSPNYSGIWNPHRTPPQSRFYVRTFISKNLYCIQANIKLDSSPSRGSYARYHNGRPPRPTTCCLCVLLIYQSNFPPLFLNFVQLNKYFHNFLRRCQKYSWNFVSLVLTKTIGIFLVIWYNMKRWYMPLYWLGCVPIEYYVEVSLWLIPSTRICASAAAYAKKPAPWALSPLMLKASAKSMLTYVLTAVPAQAHAPLALSKANCFKWKKPRVLWRRAFSRIIFCRNDGVYAGFSPV